MISVFDEPVGLLKEATITAYDSSRGTIKATLTSSNVKIQPKSIDINFPHALYSNNGLFVGAKPFPRYSYYSCSRQSEINIILLDLNLIILICFLV